MSLTVNFSGSRHIPYDERYRRAINPTTPLQPIGEDRLLGITAGDASGGSLNVNLVLPREVAAKYLWKPKGIWTSCTGFALVVTEVEIQAQYTPRNFDAPRLAGGALRYRNVVGTYFSPDSQDLASILKTLQDLGYISCDSDITIAFGMTNPTAAAQVSLHVVLERYSIGSPY